MSFTAVLPRLISKTPSSVISRSTTPAPVSGRLHSLSSLGAPDFSQWSMTTTTRFTPATRSMAPPMPLTILPGTIQLARSPFWATCMPPKIDRAIWPPRIIAKESALEK